MAATLRGPRRALPEETLVRANGVDLCVQTFGVSQLAYGSDTPIVDARPTLDAVRGFGDAVTHVLQSDTPARILS